MSAISAGNLTLLRSKPDTHKTAERLYVYGFPVAWTGRVNDGAIARGQLSIAYNTGAMESGYTFATDLRAGQLLLVGSSAGADDLGRRRLLAISGTATSGTIVADWNDDLAWVNSGYLTIVNFFPPWPKYSWFTATGPDFRKDGPPSGSGGAGIDYSAQNLTPPPHLNIGRNYAGERIAGSLIVQLDAAATVVSGATVSSYGWFAIPAGGASFSSTTSATPTVTFSTDGARVIGCTVTDSNANTFTAIRHYIIGGAITDFQRGPIVEAFDQTSVRCDLTLTSPDSSNAGAIRPAVDYTDLAEMSLIIITAADTFGTTAGTISYRSGNHYTSYLHILYSGYVIAENRSFDAGGMGSVQLSAVTAVDMFLYSLSLTGVRAPADWYEMASDLMTMGPLLYHLLYWHSTLLEVAEWWLPWSDTVKRSAVEEWTEGNIIDRARSLAGPYGRLMAITTNSQGETFVEIDANLLDPSDRAAMTTTLTLTGGDIDTAQAARVRILRYPQVAQVFVAGGSSDGVMGTFTPFLSISGNVRIAGGVGALNYERLMLPDQTEANRLCGRVLAVANRRLFEIDMELTGNYREVFSPAGQQWTNTGTAFGASFLPNLRSTDDLENLLLIPRQVTKNPPGSGFGAVGVIFDIEAPDGLDGRTVTLPTIDPNYIPSATVEPPLNGEPAAVVMTGDNTNGVEKYDAGLATWATRNSGLSGADLVVYDLKIVPYWWFYQASSNPEDAMLWIASGGGLHLSQSLGRTWQNRTPLAALDGAPAGVTAETVAYIAVDTPGLPASINQTIVAAAREDDAPWYSVLLVSTNGGYTWTSVQTEPGGNETMVLALRIDQSAGSQLYEGRLDVTAGNLYVRRLDVDLAAVGGTEVDLGAATEAEVASRDFRLALYTLNDPSVASNEDYCLAFGRLAAT